MEKSTAEYDTFFAVKCAREQTCVYMWCVLCKHLEKDIAEGDGCAWAGRLGAWGEREAHFNCLFLCGFLPPLYYFTLKIIQSFKICTLI